MWVCVHVFPLFDFALSFTCVHYGLLCLTIFFPLINQLVTSAIRLSAVALDLFKWAVFIYFFTFNVNGCTWEMPVCWLDKRMQQSQKFCMLFLYLSPTYLCP